MTKRCTCDDIGEGACPSHGKEGLLQDLRNLIRNCGNDDATFTAADAELAAQNMYLEHYNDLAACDRDNAEWRFECDDASVEFSRAWFQKMARVVLSTVGRVKE